MEWASESEEKWLDAVRNFSSYVSRRVEKAVDAVKVPDGKYPEAYQVLVDELAPLVDRQRSLDQFENTLRGFTDPRGVRAHFAGEVFTLWKESTRSKRVSLHDRISLIRGQMNPKEREGSKVQVANSVRGFEYDALRRKARSEELERIASETPAWAAIEEEAKSIEAVLEKRRDEYIQTFMQSINMALADLQSALLAQIEEDSNEV